MSNGQSPVISQRRLGDLLSEIESGKLKVRPIFQRRLVWTNIVKDAFILTPCCGNSRFPRFSWPREN